MTFDIQTWIHASAYSGAAIAMGFAVSETIKELGSFSSSVTQEVSWDSGFKQIAQAFQNNGATTLWVKSSIVDKR